MHDGGDLVNELRIFLGTHRRMRLGDKPLVLAQCIDALKGLRIFGVADDQEVVVVPQHIEHRADLPADQLHLLAQPRPFQLVNSRLPFDRQDAGRAGPKANESHELHGIATQQPSKKRRKNLRRLYLMSKKEGRPAGRPLRGSSFRLGGANVVRARALLALLDIEADGLAAAQAIEVERGIDTTLMEEILLAIIGGDEPKSAVGNDFLDGAFWHCPFSSSRTPN